MSANQQFILALMDHAGSALKVILPVLLAWHIPSETSPLTLIKNGMSKGAEK